MKKLVSILLCFCFIFSSSTVFSADYDEEGAYWECYTLYPDFVEKIKDQGVTDEQIIAFLESVESNIQSYEEVLSEENFDDYMFTALQDAFNLRKHIKVRNALLGAYPDAVEEAMDKVVPEEFQPIYDTVKRFLFGIKEPVITISMKSSDDENSFYAHSVNLKEDCTFVLAVYDYEGTVIHSKKMTPNQEGEPLVCSCPNAYEARLFAWDNFSPLCNPYILKIR